jgi:hypothetical protein
VINTLCGDKAGPSGSSRSSGVTLLDDYLEQCQVAVMQAGVLHVAVPRTSKEPWMASS